MAITREQKCLVAASTGSSQLGSQVLGVHGSIVDAGSYACRYEKVKEAL